MRRASRALAAAARGRGRGHRHRLPAFLSQSGARTTGGRQIVERVAPGLPVFCSGARPGRSSANTSAPSPPPSAATCSPAWRTTSARCRQALKDAGVPADPRLTKSNGGVMTAEQGKRECVQMILSGTASGVIGAGYVAEICGIERCHEPRHRRHQRRCGDHHRRHSRNTAWASMIGEFQIHIPSVSVSSIGEGGGSIAWVDSQGVLQVGPESAGSTPGPGLLRARRHAGDHHRCLRRLRPHRPCRPRLQRRARSMRQGARGGGRARAQALGRSVEETAEAIIQIAVSGMYAEVSAGLALRRRSARVGSAGLRRRRADAGLFPGARAAA